jgi:predicted phosphodiesterase
MLTFLHLSDIHFADFAGPEGQHVDERVRDLMLEDIERMANRLGSMDAILLVGDVANKGQEGEYRLASDFLDRVAALIGCERENLACVPGNHDIDRGEHDAVHSAVRRALRAAALEEVSVTLRALLNEDHGARVLFDPLAAYNRFALQYGCAIGRDEIVWTPKAFDLDGRELLVHGATSAWICDATDGDTDDGKRLVVGDFQCCQIAPRPDTVSLAMIHHPPNWVRDTERVQPWMNRAQVILTGHEHAAGIERDPSGRRVTIASGAVNPERTKRGWVPAYNVLRLELTGDTKLDVSIFARCWQRDVAEFGPDDRFADPFPLTITLGPTAGAPAEASPPEPPQDVPPPEPEPFESDARTLVFEIMRAPPDARHRAARSLGFVREEDALGLALDRQILARAREQHRLQELKERIDDE